MLSRRAGPPRRRPAVLALATAAVTTLAMAASGSGQAGASPPPASPGGSGTFIVQLTGEPVTAYRGTVSGLRATAPAPGAKVDARSADVQRYRAHLNARRQAVLSSVPGVKKLYNYDFAYNGFSAKLTAEQVVKLMRTPGVAAVHKSERVRPDTISTPQFMGLTGSAGVWQRQFGGTANAGSGVIVGILDTGFWPENPSFAALPEPRPDQVVIDAKWRGTCDAGTEEPVTCNNKVLGARFYHNDIDPIDPEFLSPRDHNGHGSHTASTAAGNHGVTAIINGQPVGTASGMAPAARLSIYKICWTVNDVGDASCGTSDSVAAIDQAVADGVDVINYSISGSMTSIVNPVETAFFNAARAGVFVATSAGNSGPGSTVAHNAPWQTTVAASTHDRSFRASVTLGDGRTFPGVGLGQAVPTSDLVYARDVARSGADPAQAALCFLGTLDPAKVAGKVVLCDRGVNARTDKSQEVRDAGGVGTVLANVTPNSLNADFHFVPTVHVDDVAGAAIRTYAQGAGARAALAAGVPITAQAPEMAAFSSNGPALAGGGDLLKPDVTAPGVDVIAAVSPASGGNMFNAVSGTSMSSPHTAGIAALVMSKRPGWSPMWVKSSLMTTAVQTDNAGEPIQRAGVPATPLDFGAGHLRRGGWFDPGLVYDSGPDQWLQYACALRQLSAETCRFFPSIDPSDLNYPSISVGDLAGSQTITRRVTNVSTTTPRRYTAVVQAPPGFRVTVSPSSFTLPRGQSRTFTVTITRTTAPFGTWAFGSLTWRDFAGHAVRSPIAVRPVALAAPVEVTASGAAGSRVLPLKAGFTGTLDASVAGLVPAQVDPLALRNPTGEAFDTSNPQTNDHVGRAVVTVPAGTRLARFATFDADLPVGADVDLFAYRQGPEGLELIGVSAGPTAEESVTLPAAEAGTYEIFVDLFALPGGTTEATVRHHGWAVGAAAGNATVAPASQAVTLGQAASVTVSWTGLAAGTRYLGAVVYASAGTEVGTTVVRVDT